MEGIVVSLFTGGIAGWLAGQILKGGGQGLLMNVVIGVIGGVIGSELFGLAGVAVGPGFAGAIVSATVGAVVLLFVVGKLRNS